MDKRAYISEDERQRCQRVADAFAELYELEHIVVMDVGRYGFVNYNTTHQSGGLKMR